MLSKKQEGVIRLLDPWITASDRGFHSAGCFYLGPYEENGVHQRIFLAVYAGEEQKERDESLGVLYLGKDNGTQWRKA